MDVRTENFIIHEKRIIRDIVLCFFDLLPSLIRAFFLTPFIGFDRALRGIAVKRLKKRGWLK